MISPPTARAGRRAGRRALALVVVALALIAPAAVAASDGADDAIRLALTPVGQPGSWFDLSIGPGERRTLEVDIANDGALPIVARTYAADVYTVVNGGFGGSLRDRPVTGMTTWLDYSANSLALAPGDRVRRSFTVAVPRATPSGEYITSLILENEAPLSTGGALGLRQIVRQAVAVVVTVPGPRSPGLAIGAATHLVVGGTSVVRVAVENTGNVRLKPLVEFTLADGGGAPISSKTMAMDTFYARTDTALEFPLAALLAPGTYTVALTIRDEASGVEVSDLRIPLTVVSTAVPGSDLGVAPGLIGVLRAIPGDEDGVIVGGAAALALLIALAAVARRRNRQSRRLDPRPN